MKYVSVIGWFISFLFVSIRVFHNISPSRSLTRSLGISFFFFFSLSLTFLYNHYILSHTIFHIFYALFILSFFCVNRSLFKHPSSLLPCSLYIHVCFSLSLALSLILSSPFFFISFFLSLLLSLASFFSCLKLFTKVYHI